MSPGPRIRRRTRGGTLTLSDSPPLAACCSCGARPAGDRDRAPIGLQSTVDNGPALTTAICADCISEALAILFGRRHVQDGGSVADLKVPE